MAKPKTSRGLEAWPPTIEQTKGFWGEGLVHSLSDTLYGLKSYSYEEWSGYITKCECGSEAIGGLLHSHWCAKYEEPNESA